MRVFSLSGLLLVATATPAIAADPGQAPDLLSPSTGLMFWTLAIFVVLLFVLSKFAFKPITAAVEARERALEEAIEGAKRDRDEAARVLAEHRQNLEAARGEAQKIIADGRAMAEKMRQDLLDQTRREQGELLERARRDIEAERDKAIHALRKEAVDLAIAGASKVIEQNLDSDANRRLVDGYLGSLGNLSQKH